MKIQISTIVFVTALFNSSASQAQISVSIKDKTKNNLGKPIMGPVQMGSGQGSQRGSQRGPEPRRQEPRHQGPRHQEPSRDRLSNVLEDLDRVKDAAEDRDFDFVVQMSYDIERDLNRYDYDRKLYEAKASLRCIRDRATDRRSTSYEKMNGILDDLSGAREAIRRSETYLREIRYSEPRRPVEPRRPNLPRGQEQVFGQTEHFSKSKIETRTVSVFARGDVVALRIKALDDMMSIQSITVVLNDGRQLHLEGMIIGENDSTIIELEGRYRLREVTIKGSSGNIFGTKAKVQVSGF